MYDEQTVSRLIHLIYDAALNPVAWQHFLHTLAATVEGHAVNLGYTNCRQPSLSVSASAEWDPAAVHEYHQYYGTCDPWAQIATRAGRLVPGTVGLGKEVISQEELTRTEFYNDYGRRYGFTGGVTGVILQEKDTLAVLSASSFRNDSFEEEEVRLFGLLLPHLRRAFEIHNRLTGLESERAATAEAVNQLPIPLILVDRAAVAVLITAAAAAIVAKRDGLEVTRGLVTAAVPAENARLQNYIAACRETTMGRGIRDGGALLISRPSGREAFRVLVTPLRSDNQLAPRGLAAAAIFISDPEDRTVTEDRLLRAFFNLTGAEARLASLLARGVLLQDASDVLGIAHNTARGYLKVIFSKTNTRSQAQLVRAILSLPRVHRR